MKDLKNVSTDELAMALRERMLATDVRVWPTEVYNLVTAISPITCVDAFPIRMGSVGLEMGFIRRNTGFYKGRLWCVGGRVNVGESFSEALTRHVRGTLGVGFVLHAGISWNKPVCAMQYPPQPITVADGESSGHDPSKHAIASTYLIHLESESFSYGSTAHGGQEAASVEWFPADELPPENEIAYGGAATVRMCAEWLRDI